MKDFLVTWEIDISADTAREAAEIAETIQRDPSSFATVFTVVDDDGNSECVDTSQRDDQDE